MQTYLTCRTTLLSALVLLSFGVGTTRTALGNVLVYRNQPDFFRAANIISTETFDEFPTPTTLGIGTVIIDGITYTSDQPTSRWIAGILINQVPPQFVSSPNDFGPSLIGNVTLTFGGATDAIGFYILHPRC